MSRTVSHVSMRLVHVSDSFIPKGPWELLWLVQAHRPVFGSVKLAPIKYEKSFVPRHMKSDEGPFWTSTWWVDTWALDMAMWYWLVAILFWQLLIDHIVNGQCKRCGFAKTRLRHPSLPFDSLPYPTRTICRRVRTYVRTLGQSRDNQTKRGWPYSMSMGLCLRAREPR